MNKEDKKGWNSRPDLDNLLEGFQIIGFDWKYLYLNNIAKVQSHLKKKELVGKRFDEVWPGVKETELYRLIRNCLENRTAHHLENEFIYPDQTLGYFDLSIQPIPEGVLILSVDITKRKKNEVILRRSEERFRSLFENMLNGFAYCQILLKDGRPDDFIYINVNKAFESLTGLKNVVGKKASEAIPGIQESDSNLIETYGRVAITGKAETFEVFVEALKDWYSISVYCPEKEYFIAVFDVITERKLVESELRESEKKFKNLVWDMQVGVLIQGPKAEILLSNPKALELLGLTEDQLLGKTSFDPDWNVIHEDGSPFPGPTHPVALAISSQKPVREVVMGVYRPFFDDRIWLLVDAFPQLNEDGTIRQVVCSFNNITKRKEAEESLKKSEDLFNKAFHGSPSSLAIVAQSDRKYIAVNDTFLQLTEFSRDEIIGHNSAEIGLIRVEDVTQIVADLNEQGRLRNFEISIWSKSGKPIHLLSSSENVELAGQLCTISTMIDITERKLAEKALIESETKFRKIYEEGPFGMAMVNREFRFLAANNTFCSITGYTEYELQKLTFQEITKEEDIETNVQSIKMLINGEITVYKTEKRYIRKDGLIIWGALTVTANYDLNGQFLYNLAIIEDITGRKQAEADLRESEEKFRLLIENIPLPVISSDKDGKVIFRNEQFLKTFGYTETDIPTIREWWEKAYPDPEYRKKVIESRESALSGGESVYTDLKGNEYKITCKDGSERVVIISGIKIGDKLLATFFDITERKLIEEEILKLNTELESRVSLRTSQLVSVNNELEAFSYSVSHDLRAPVRSISGFTQILFEEYGSKLDDEGKRICSVIQENSLRMGTLIDDLLAFSRLNRTELNKSVVNMKDLVSSAYNELTDEVSVKRIEFTLGNICNSAGDPKLLKQVWINLISNAIKYSSKKEKSIITIGCKKEEGFCVYHIKDNGVGFDMAYMDKLFGVFQRLHGQREFDGTGVGLAIVQRIIQRHGGRTWAKGEVDKGAEFYFSIPIVTEI